MREFIIVFGENWMCSTALNNMGETLQKSNKITQEPQIKDYNTQSGANHEREGRRVCRDEEKNTKD